MAQVNRPMQIALVATVLLAGMWFTVLKPKPAASTGAATPAVATPTPAKVAPGVKGLASAVDKAKGASATSDATNAKIQAASGSTTASTQPAGAVTKTTAAHAAAAKAKAKAASAAKPGTKGATAKAPTATSTAVVDPSNRLLAYLAKGKTLVILFHGDGIDDRAARKAVHRTALADPKHVVSAYVPIADVGEYEAITSDVQVLSAPTILVIGTDHKATVLTGFVDEKVVRQTVGDARRGAVAVAK